jgi:hypothetical protein
MQADRHCCLFKVVKGAEWISAEQGLRLDPDLPIFSVYRGNPHFEARIIGVDRSEFVGPYESLEGCWGAIFREAYEWSDTDDAFDLAAIGPACLHSEIAQEAYQIVHSENWPRDKYDLYLDFRLPQEPTIDHPG